MYPQYPDDSAEQQYSDDEDYSDDSPPLRTEYSNDPISGMWYSVAQQLQDALNAIVNNAMLPVQIRQALARNLQYTINNVTNNLMTYAVGSPDINTIVAIAQAEYSQPDIATQHPLPDTEGELEGIGDTLEQTRGMVAELHEHQLPLTVAEISVTIQGLREVVTRSDRLAWQVAMHAVERGLISQVKAAELLGSSSATVSRRYREDPDETEEQ